MRYKIIIALVLVISLLGIFPQRLISQGLEISEQSVTNQIDYFATLYGADSRIVKRVVDCESNGLHSAKGDGGRSVGIAQFQKATFLDLEYKMGEDLNYSSSFDQLKLLTWSIANGHGNRWTAYRALKNGGVYSFHSTQLNRDFTVRCPL